MKLQEKRVILNNLEKLIKQNISDPLLTECLYCLGVELSSKESSDFQKYYLLLTEFRAKNYTTIDKIPIGEHGQLWSSNGYYHFSFKNVEIARKAEITRSILKDYFNFVWNNHEKAWTLKQTHFEFNIDHFNQVMLEKIADDLSKV